MLRALVRSLAGGDLADLEVPAETTFGELKTKVLEGLKDRGPRPQWPARPEHRKARGWCGSARSPRHQTREERPETHWHLPPPFYRFVLGEQALKDSGRLGDDGRGEQGGELLLTLVVSLSMLEDDDEMARAAALHALDALVHEGPETREGALCSACTFFGDESAQIRRLALKVASEVADARDSRLMEAAMAFVGAEHEEAQVVVTALEVLSKGSEPGDAGSVAAVGACLDTAQDKYGEDVLFAAIRALGAVAGKGDAAALSALQPALESGNGYVRLIALDTVGVIATGAAGSASESAALALLRGRLEDRESNMRRKAVELIPAVLPCGDARCTELLLPLLQDRAESVRCATLVQLGAAAGRGSAPVVEAVCACVSAEGGGVDVRCTGLEVLAKLAEPGCEAALALGRASLEDAEEDVRDAAEELLSALGTST